MKNDRTDSTSEIKHRLVVPIQTRGNIGKSTEAVARCEWMLQRGVTWAGYDLDRFNRTLSTTYPHSVQFLDPGDEPESAIITVLRRITHAEVTIIDPSAHLDRAMLDALRKVNFAEVAKGAQARLTVLVFPIDESVRHGRHRPNRGCPEFIRRLGRGPQSRQASEDQIFRQQ